MYGTREIIMTYDPTSFEEHEDSTDFEERKIPNVGSRKGNHSLLNIEDPPSPISINRQNKIMFEEYDKYPVKLSNGNHKFSATEVQIGPQKVKIKGRNLNRGDEVSISAHTVQSKMSGLKHKLIPVLSSLFKRSNKKVVKECPKENTMDQCCQHCNYCERRRVRKLYKRQNYAVQPVYALEGIHQAQAPFGQTKITEEPLKSHDHKNTTNQYSACSSSSSESETQLVKERQQKIHHFRRRLKSEFVKERMKYQQNQHFKNQNLQFPPKDTKSPYQVYSSSCHQTVGSRVSHESEIKYLTDMQSSSSGFWDYLFDKFNRKYATNRIDMPKPQPCSCGVTTSSQMTCTPDNCQLRNKETTRGRSATLPTLTKLPTNIPPLPKIPNKKRKKSNHICECTQVPEIEENNNNFRYQCTQLPTAESSKATETAVGDVLKGQIVKDALNPCQCIKCRNNNERQTLKETPASHSGRSEYEATKPCQEGHDEITSLLAEKYNGEILCIHNPPCILINGCLNLPSQKSQPQTNLWAVTETKKPGFCEGFRKKKSKAKWEQACQYHMPYVDVQQCHIPAPEYKTEKIIQSVCNHSPPCEVVRGCYKPKFDPALQNSCIHVPMCSKIPQCTMGQPEAKNCDHRPKCQNIPVCSRNTNYAVLTARETVGTQAKPRENLVCRHVPPCIMIPRCLGRTMFENCIPFDAIPGCIHQPPCELIPACCRKATKEMVTASSQYPNSCRIV